MPVFTRRRDHEQRRPQKITLGDMRSTGLRNLLVYCGDFKCAHHVEIGAERWSDDVRLSDSSSSLARKKAGHEWPPPKHPQEMDQQDYGECIIAKGGLNVDNGEQQLPIYRKQGLWPG